MNHYSTAKKRLLKEYQQLIKDPPPGIIAGPISEDNIFLWECLIEGPQDTIYENGVFTVILSFPKDYPLGPPEMRFDPPLLHPNIYPDGNVCISILHSPGDDPNYYESHEERWSPIQSIEKILLSVISILSDPNVESVANINASILWRENKEEFTRQVKEHIKNSLGL